MKSLREHRGWGDRRGFLRLLFVTTASGLVLEREWSGLLICDVEAAIPSGDSWLQLRVSDFPSLAREGGSVRLGTSVMEGTFPRGLFWPVIVTRGAGDRFYVLESRCAHADCVVRAYNATTGAITCPCHGSQYAIDGTVLNGPASFPLTDFPWQYDGVDTLDIQLPPWVFFVRGSGRVVDLGSGKASRFEVAFATFTGLTYEIRQRAAVGDRWQRVSFALTPEGPADATSLAGRDETVKVYLEKPAGAGFFAVTLRTFEV